ncbi:MAG: protein-glutamate O-methyltransferase CheR [candidate division WOR-3 bacterium]
MDEIDYKILVDYISQKIGIDGNIYKERPFKRRLMVRMRATGKKSFMEYLQFLKNDKEELNILKETLTINVTRFFRNRETFDYLEEIIFPEIIKKKKRIRILSVGCSTGEEVYSLNMIIKRLKLKNEFNYEIVGIDVDEDAIKKANIGLYKDYSLIELTESEINRYFKKMGDYYSIDESLKENIYFKLVDIKEENILFTLGKFDFIICRNVLIYFSKEFQEKIFNVFYELLLPDGFLVLGKVEILTGNTKILYKPINIKERVFKKIDNQYKDS